MESNYDSRGYLAQETQQSELDKTKKENEYLKKKVALEEKKNEELENEKLSLSWRSRDICQEQQKKIDVLTRENNWFLQTNKELHEQNKELHEQNKELHEQNKELHEQKQQLHEQNKELHEQNKQRCEKTCVLRIIIWVCNYFLKGSPCERKLEKVLTYRAAKKIASEEAQKAQKMNPYSYSQYSVPKDLECLQFMNILLKSGVVEERESFKYPAFDSSGNNDARLKMLNIAWGKIGSEHVVILARVGLTAPNGEGHCVLGRKMVDGTLTIYDLQKKSPEEQIRNGNLADFGNYLMHDEGLIIYTINVDELERIINPGKKISSAISL